MTKNQLRRIVAVGGSLAVMAVGGGYASGAFAHAGTPAGPTVRISPAVGQHLGRTAAASLRSRSLELGHAAAALDAADDPSGDVPTEDPGDDNQGEDTSDTSDTADDQGENTDDQGEDTSGAADQGDQGDQGNDNQSDDTQSDDNGGNDSGDAQTGDNGGDQGGDANGD